MKRFLIISSILLLGALSLAPVIMITDRNVKTNAGIKSWKLDMRPMEFTNMIDASSFEDWASGAAAQPDGWTAEGTPTIARDTAETGRGAYNLKITATGAANEGSYQTITNLKPTTVYRLIARAKATAGDTARMVTTGATINVDIETKNTSFIDLIGQFTTDGSGTDVVLKLVAKTATDIVWFDDAQATESITKVGFMRAQATTASVIGGVITGDPTSVLFINSVGNIGTDYADFTYNPTNNLLAVHDLYLSGRLLVDAMSEYTSDTGVTIEDILVLNYDIWTLDNIYPYDAGMDIDFDSSSDSTVYIKNDNAWTELDNYDALSAYWKMEETGATARVDSHDTNDLTAVNTPSSRAGKLGQACNFADGASQTLGDNSTDFDAEATVAISMWVKFDNTTATHPLFGKENAFNLAYENDADRLIVRLTQVDHAVKTLSTGVTPNTTGFHHYLMIADGTKIYLYLDNVSIGTPEAYDGTINFDFTATFGFGVYAGGGSHTGAIDEAAFWKDPTFATDAARIAFVAALWNGGDGLFFDDATGLASLDVQDNITLGGTFTDGTLSLTAGAISGLASATDGTASWTSSNLSGFGTITTTAQITAGTNIYIADNGYIGSASDHDAFQIKTAGDIYMTQDLSVAGVLDMNSQLIHNVADAIDLEDAVNLNTLLDHTGIDLNYWLGSTTLDLTLTDSEAGYTEITNAENDELTNIYFKSSLAETPSPFLIKAGTIIEVHWSGDETSGAGRNVGLYFQLGYVNADGTTTFVQVGSTSDTSDALTNVKTDFSSHLHVAADTTIPSGKRLWLKVFSVTVSGAGGYPTIRVYYDNSSHHMSLEAAGSVLGTFVKTDGTSPMTANWDIGNFTLTANGITIDGTLTDGTASLASGSLTSVKLGTLTGNGLIKTTSGDGTLATATADTDYLVTLLKDVVATTPLLVNATTNVDDILPGANADLTFSMPAATNAVAGYATAAHIQAIEAGWDGDIADIDLDGGTDIGAALVDADLMLVDDGAGGTNRKATMTRLATYTTAAVATADVYVTNNAADSMDGTLTITANNDVALSGTGNVTSGSEGFIVGTLTITDGSIDDTDGSISFGATGLTNVGTVSCGTIASGVITQSGTTLAATYHPLTTVGIADNNLVEIDGTANDLEFTIFNAAGIEGLTDTEVMARLSGDAAAAFSFNSQNLTSVGTIGSGAITSTGASQVGTLGVGKVADVPLHVVIGDGADPVYLAGKTAAVFQNNDDAADAANITVIGGTTGGSGIFFGDSGNDRIGYVNYTHNDNKMTFVTNANSALTISNGQIATFAHKIVETGCRVIKGDAIATIREFMDSETGEPDKHGLRGFDLQGLYLKYPEVIARTEWTEVDGSTRITYGERTSVKTDILYRAVMQLVEINAALEARIKKLEER